VKSARHEQLANSFETIAREWLKKFIDPMAPGHRKRVYARFENDVFPSIGTRPIADITPKELLEVILRIEKRDARDTAHRTLGSCGRVFRYAVSTNRCPRDITPDLRGALAPAEAGHFAAVTKPDDLAGILRGIDEYSGSLSVQCALRLAPLVFVRPGELRQAKWEFIRLADAEWLLKLSKRKDGKRGVPGIDDWLIVPLSRQAVAILKQMHALSGTGEFVFPSDRYSRRCISDNAVNMALRRMGIPKEEMCGHGFRATARTVLAQELQIRADLIEHQLGHQVIDPNGRAYNRTTFLPERRLMMQAWADYLDKLKSGEALRSGVKKRLTDIRAIQVTAFA
jgi:integrase